MKTTLAICVVLVLSFVSTSGADDSASVIRKWTHFYELCRGSYPNDPGRKPACNSMGKYELALKQMDYCYGKEGQIRAEMSWHQCEADSLRD